MTKSGDVRVIPTADELIDRMNMALTDTGYPKIKEWRQSGETDFGWPVVVIIDSYTDGHLMATPLAVWWHVGNIAYEGRVACWSCWHEEDKAPDCASGRCGSPDGPARPPKELLSR